jgi:hypothetical protein
MGTIAATERKVRMDPATDQNSLRFGLFPDREIRMEVTITIIIGTRGSALSICINQSFISSISVLSMLLYFLNMSIIMLRAMAASAAASPIINRVKIIPSGASGETNRLNATRLSPAPFIMSSIDISMPIRVLL